jgi:hypothetical protein
LFKDICSAVLYVVIGGIVGAILMAPVDPRQAFLAGFSWVGLLETVKGR